MCIRTFSSAFILYFVSSDSWIILLLIKTLSLLSYCNNGVDLSVVHAQACYKCTENFTRVSVLEWWQRSVLICRWQGSAELVVIIASEDFLRAGEDRKLSGSGGRLRPTLAVDLTHMKWRSHTWKIREETIPEKHSNCFLNPDVKPCRLLHEC